MNLKNIVKICTASLLLLYAQEKILAGGSIPYSKKEIESVEIEKNPSIGYAVLIAGKSYDDHKYEGVRNLAIMELSEIYQRLKKFGFEDKNIFIEFSGEPNLNVLDENLKSGLEKKIDEGTFEINATKQNIISSIIQTNERLDFNDLLVLYLVGDGGFLHNRENVNEPRSYLSIEKGQGKLTGQEISSILDDEKPKIGLIYAGSCNSGFFNFISYKKANYITITASQGIRDAIASNEFSFGRYFFQGLTDNDADANKDSRITIKEAFNFAIMRFDKKQKELFHKGFHPDYKTYGKIEPQIDASNNTLYDSTINLRK